MTLTYWTGFSKRKNSTKQATSGTDVTTVVLKDDTSIMNPTFDCIGVPENVNYIYVSAWGRYYFVNNVSHIGTDRLLIECECDVLATYKSNIGSTTAHIERSSAGGGWLSDALVVPTDEIVQTDITNGDTLSDLNIYGSDFVVRTVGKNGIKSYMLNAASIQNVFSTYYDVSVFDWTDIMQSIKSLVVALSDPGKYVKSIKWFPFSVASGTSEIPYFGFTAGTAAVNIAKEQIQSTAVITKPAAYYNDWRDYDARFTKCSIRFPGVGNIPIDAQYLQETLSCTYDIDVATGSCKVQLVAGTKIIGTFDGMCGVDVPFSGLSGTGGLSAIGEMFGAIGSPTFATDALKGALNVVQGALSPGQNVYNNVGNMAEWIQNPFIKMSVVRLGSSEKIPAGHGIPDKNNRQISNLSGFILCSGASVNMPGTANEKDTVNGYLNGGFYYE